jgi:taurine dioxygenase
MTAIDTSHTSTADITITPKSPTIGAEISGIDLRDELSDDTIATIRRALLDHKVLFFRDQAARGAPTHDAATLSATVGP